MATSTKPDTMGRRIRRARMWAGFDNQGELAEALDVSRQTISAWETDVQAPPRTALMALQLVTGFPVSYFLTGEMPGQTSSDGCATKPDRGSAISRPFRGRRMTDVYHERVVLAS